MSRVDVVVPCYNYGRFLEQCVRSILDQKGADVRVLIIDDASSDDTPEVGRGLAALDHRVEFRRHHVNQGHIATYNEGLLGWASAEYSLLISADDALAAGALERATRLMDGHSDVGMTYGMARIIIDDDNPTQISETASNGYRVVPGPQFLQFCCENCYNPVPTPTAVVRTEVQHRLGGYRADFPHTGDLEMWMRFAAHSSMAVLCAVQAYYRWHGKNMGSQYYHQMLDYNQMQEDRREFAKTCEYALAPSNAQFAESGLWLKSMFQRLDEQAFRSASDAFNRGDMAGCHAWVEFGEEISVNRRRSGMWWRLGAKRLLGQTLWRRMRPALNRFRGIRDTSVEPPQMTFRPAWARPGEKIGWSPE